MEDLQKLTNNDVKNIKVLARKAIDEMEGENTAEVWRCISQTVDRLMLLIFIIVYVTINVALLLQVPKVNLNWPNLVIFVSQAFLRWRWRYDDIVWIFNPYKISG